MSHSDFIRSEMSRQHRAELAREVAEIRAAREQSSANPRTSLRLGLAAAWQKLAAVVAYPFARPGGGAIRPIR